MEYHGRKYDIGFNRKKIVEVTNKINTITLHYGKAAKTISYEGEILDYVIYNRALGNTGTSNEVIFNL